MKLFIISDIHGSAAWLDRALAIYEQEEADQLILLGDLLYHGPRNPLPEGYDPERVATALNAHKDKIIAVRGNCDAEVDQMLLDFPMMADYTVVMLNKMRLFISHGHVHSMDQLPPLSVGDVFMQGHTHVPVAERRGSLTMLNPGSISLPKENFHNSYAILDDDQFYIKDFAGNTMMQITLSSF